MALIVAGVVTVACGGDGDDPASTPVPSPPTQAPNAATATAAPAAAAPEIPPGQCGSTGISTEGDVRATVTFVNETDAPVLIDWVNYEGELERYTELAPGARYDQPTWITHPWVVSRDDGTCLATYTVIEERGTVTIR
jgi:hypothetical protein